MRIYLTEIFVIVFLLLFSCSKEENSLLEINVFPEEIVVIGSGEIREFEVKEESKLSYEVTSEDDWIQISLDGTASMNKTFKINVLPNGGDKERVGYIYIAYGATKKSIKVVQSKHIVESEYELNVSKISAVIPNIGGIATFQVESNLEWEIILDQDNSWCTIDDNTLVGYGNKVVTVRGDQNQNVELNRTAKLKVRSKTTSAIEKDIVITQSSFVTLLDVNPNSLQLGKNIGDQGVFQILTTYDLALHSSEDWFSVSTNQINTFMEECTVTVTVLKANTGVSPRTGKIEFKNGSSVVGSIEVVQKGNVDDFVDFQLAVSNLRVSTIQNSNPVEGSIAALFDNDKSTFFTSYWNSYNITVPQWIVVDLGAGNETKGTTFQYTTRNYPQLHYMPTEIIIQATNQAPTSHVWKKEGDAYTDSDRTWVDIAYFSGAENCPIGVNLTSPKLVSKSDIEYRYWRFYVKQATQNPTYLPAYPNAFCIHIAELKVQTLK